LFRDNSDTEAVPKSRSETAEFSLDPFGQLQRRRVLQPGPTICRPAVRPARNRSESQIGDLSQQSGGDYS
jgi:hypothetical protein